MITISVGDLIKGRRVLLDLSQHEMPARDGIKFVRLMKKVDEEYNNYKQVESNTVDKYAEKNEDGEFVLTAEGGKRIIPQHADDCVNELNELYKVQIEIAAEPIPFTIIENLNISPAHLSLIQGLIDFGST